MAPRYVGLDSTFDQQRVVINEISVDIDTLFGSIPVNINDLSDVNAGAPSTGQVLKWSGSEWQAASDLTTSGAGIGLSDLSVTIAPSGINSLTYNNVTGVFLFTPVNLSGYATTTSIVGFITSGALSGYATQGYVNATLVGYATQGYVNNAIVGFITSGGSGSNLSGVVTSLVAGANITLSESTGRVIIDASSDSNWRITTLGINTLSNVGIGTTNSTSKLTVQGDANFTGVITAASFSGNAASATYATSSGIATYAPTSGVSTYATSSGLSTYATSSGIATYATSSGLSTYATSSGLSTYATSSGISTQSTKLQNTRTFQITGDIVGAAVTFDGTGNVSIAATIQPNSVALGSDTTGDYVQSLSGTSNQITVTNGTGEGSTPSLSVPNQFTAPQDVTVTRDLQVNRNLNVNGNITIGGTSATLFTTEFKVYDPDIVLGFRTDVLGNDISTDTTANHGGIAIASTEGSPLISLYDVGIGETNPATYKKIMWFKSGTFSGLGTDAWISNYAIGIGSTQVPNGVRLAAGGMQVTDSTISAPQLNISGISTYTNGPVLIGSGTSTGTASQPLQVNGGAYVSGNLGVGNTNPGATLNVVPTATSIAGLFSGTTSSDMVRITQRGTGNALVVEDSANPDATPFVVNTTGNIGVGTTSPQRKLHLRATGADGIFLDNSDQTGNSGGPLLRVRGQRVDGNVSQSFSGQLVLERWRMDASIDSGQNLGAIIFGGNYDTLPGITTGMTYGASIGAIAEGAFSNINTAPTAIVFNTGTVGLGTLTLSNLTYGTEAARITSNRNLLIGVTSETGTASQPLQVTGGTYVSGNIGVGVTNPASKIDVHSPTSGSTAIRATVGPSYSTDLYLGAISGLSTDAAGSHRSQFVAAGAGATSSELGVYSFYPSFANFPSDKGPRRAVDLVGGFSTGVWGTEYFSINVGKNGSANDAGTLTNERLRVDGNGNVGIATINPSTKLHVVGDSTVSGVTNLNQITETVVNAFNTTLAPSAGTFTVDTSLGTVILGDLNASVTTWAFTNVPTTNSKATTITLIIDGDTAQTYGDACSVNGSAITGGVKWSGSSAPAASNNFDIITFTIVRDSAGTINVFGSVNTDFS